MVFSGHSAADITQFDIRPIEQSSDKVLGFYVESTASINVEDTPTLPPPGSVRQKIQEIAEYLVASEAPQIVISIHGYGTLKSDAEDRYRKMCEYATDICQPKTSVFFGYRWPSEKPSGDPSIPNESFATKRSNALEALPSLLKILLFGGLSVSVILVAFLLITTYLARFLTPVLVGSLVIFGVLLALILLRLSTYFRDNYRATNYGVPDLVELIRQLDSAIARADTAGAIAQGKKVKLTFLGHSMGCFVVTNTIRILSDVFDQASIEKRPPSNIGQMFCLERLILVAPDIPVETVIPRRANFLRSSLRRCSEAYVFSSEGDLALRLASTAANYFSFPARTRFSGYRLGNLTAKRFASQSDRTKRKLDESEYGIVNLTGDTIDSPYYCLEIRSSDKEHKLLSEVRMLGDTDKENQGTPLSNMFTYFDCTDYWDIQGDPSAPNSAGPSQGIVSYGLKKSALNLMDYISLSAAFFLSKSRYINVHGGYFDGILSQQLIYKLAFLGFTGMLVSLDDQNLCQDHSFQSLPTDIKKSLLNELSNQCQEKQIQVVLAPTRYEKDILNRV